MMGYAHLRLRLGEELRGVVAQLSWQIKGEEEPGWPVPGDSGSAGWYISGGNQKQENWAGSRSCKRCIVERHAAGVVGAAFTGERLVVLQPANRKDQLR